MLLGVSGIGPKGALGVMSGLSADTLRFAVLSGDAATIAKAPGIGKKTAQKIILELKDKVDLEDAFEKKVSHTEERAGFFNCGTACHFQMRSHFICNDSGERSLSESRRAVEKHMVEAVSALFRCVDIYPKSLLSLILTYVFFQSLRSETRFYSAVFKCCLSCYLPFGRH